MVKGYIGEILKIDLSNRKIETEILETSDLKNFIGGSGLGAKYLHKLTNGETRPFSEENALIFMTGPLTAAKTFSSDRFEVIAKSPLTGIYAESSCGGRWGGMLKRSGYDGIILTGKSDIPVFIWIDNKKVKIENCKDIWGQDTFKTHISIRKKTSEKAEIACIGPAGEKLVKFASIHTGGVHSRVAGRAGIGAVMGSKKLKAIAVKGEQRFEIYDPKSLEKFWKDYAKKVANTFDAKDMRENGTIGILEYCEEIGDLPIKNWTERRYKDAEKISNKGLKSILKKRYYCGSCLVGCGRSIEIENGKYITPGIIGGPEYETVAMFGSNLLVNDIGVVAKCNEICNRYGMDTISTGSVLGMVMECREKGLLTRKELDNIDLNWGNGDAVIEMLYKIGKREGIGELLGEGTRNIAKEIGPEAMELAVQVKGLEAPAHDPRAKNSLALGYAVSNRGACHLQSFGYDFEHLCSIEDMGYPEPLNRFETKGKPEFVCKMENLMSMMDSLTTCKFMLFCNITLKQLTEELNLVTGFGIDETDFLKTGERIFNLKRLYNIKCGITKKDDILPPRLLTLKKGSDEDDNVPPPFEMMLKEYYKLRGWNEIGVPKDKKVEELDLKEYS